jgi:hypothetical protein
MFERRALMGCLEWLEENPNSHIYQIVSSAMFS